MRSWNDENGGIAGVIHILVLIPYLNSVFTYFSGKFEKSEIQTEWALSIGDEKLPYMELCQILSNGLENAWYASMELPPEKRKVSVQMRYNREYLLIRIKNHCNSDVFVEKGELPVSTKGGAEHGFGLRTIQEAARRLEGEMMCYTDKGYFFLDVMIKMEQKNNAVPSQK